MSNLIVWTDIETSGLNETEGHLLEVSLVVTDDKLEVRESAHLTIAPVGIHVERMIETLDPYVRDMHERNGLLQELRAGRGVRRYEAEESLVAFCKGAFENEPDVGSHRCANCGLGERSHLDDGPGLLKVLCPDDEQGTKGFWNEKMDPALKHTPLAGSTVSFDRRWLKEHMPKLEALFSHRNIDVSTVTELAKRWAPPVYEARPRSTEQHRALGDILGSIDVLRYYRKAGFIGGAS